VKFAVVFLLCSLSAFAQHEKSPGYAEYQTGLGLFNQAKYQESMTALDRALHLDANLVPALTLKAKLAMSIKRFDVARECLEHALSVEPSSWYAQFLYGFNYYQQNEMPRAIAALEKARRLNPRDPRAALYLGMAYETTGKTTEALSLYQEAIRLDDATGKLHVDALLTCARLLMVMGDLDRAGSLVDRAIKDEPASRDAHFERGRFLLKKDQPAEAAKEGETALRLRSGEITDRQVHFLLVQVYQALGREREAAQHAEAVRQAEKQ